MPNFQYVKYIIGYMFLDRHFHHPIRRSASSPLWLFGLVFVLGLAIGSLIPVRGHLPWHPSSASIASSVNSSGLESAPPIAPTNWSRDGNPSVRHSVDVLRVIDGDTFEARVHLWPGLEMVTRGAPAQHRCAGDQGRVRRGKCAWRKRRARRCVHNSPAAMSRSSISVPTNITGRVVADAATRRTPSVSNAMLASGHARAYQGGKRGGWCDSVR